ncbi:hypothetical protein BDV96DRAFT_572274 [Lophiotrema nucula]|uniref:Uncharacterized protein n=1 Tax=Lophiotrema nucula TaxID=690887 RepID=A0A6A5ZAM5_9PLEO|nr:hypothetical protein BDV96DRAFT_572274 [Lophiotrema nucula]
MLRPVAIPQISERLAVVLVALPPVRLEIPTLRTRTLDFHVPRYVVERVASAGKLRVHSTKSHSSSILRLHAGRVFFTAV